MGIAATWTEDVSMYSFIWAVFMGAGAMVYEKRHFAFTSISDMMKNDKIKSIKMCIRDSEKSTLFRKCVAFCLLGSIPNPLKNLSNLICCLLYTSRRQMMCQVGQKVIVHIKVKVVKILRNV